MGDFFYVGDYHNFYEYVNKHCDDKNIETILNVIDKKKHSEFERFMLYQDFVSQYRDTTYHYPVAINRDRILDFHARKYVRTDSLKKALYYLKQIRPEYWLDKNYPYTDFSVRNPFVLAPGYQEEIDDYLLAKLEE